MIRLVLALALGTLTAGAHEPGLSTATVDLSSGEILVQVAFAPADLAAARGASPAELAPESVELRTAATLLTAKTVETRTVGADNVEFTLRFSRPARGEVTFRARLFDRLPFGHRQALTVRDENGLTSASVMLSASHDSAVLPAKTPHAARPSSRVNLLLAAALLTALTLGWYVRQRRTVTAAS